MLHWLYVLLQAIRDSPRLRQAASTAASVMSSAATTARARFEITSRTIGNMLAASAQSFEDFVGEHLQGDAGWEQVVMTDGCNNLLVPRSKVLTQTFLVGPRCCLCWEFRVKVRRGVQWCNVFSERKHSSIRAVRGPKCVFKAKKRLPT